MTKPTKQERIAERRAKAAALRAAQARKERGYRLFMLGGFSLVLVLIAVATVLNIKLQDPDRDQVSIAKVQTYKVPSRNHVTGTVDYAQTPPVGGDHSGVWLNCGYYADPVANENAVHDMEHGAVWITYQPDLPADQVDQLRQIAAAQTFVTISPFPGLSRPVVASAWGKQLLLDNASDPRLAKFVRAYRVGPQTPEPGAPCTGGTGSPSSG